MNKPIPLSLRQKSSARLAAVQCLYRLRLMDETVAAEALADEYLSQWKDDRESGSRVLSRDAEPDKSVFRRLLRGVTEREAEINTLIATSLNEKWTAERMSPLLLAIMACAIFEMRFGAASLNPAIIIDEYVTLTGRFFEAPEVGFVNGFLDALAKSPRGGGEASA